MRAVLVDSDILIEVCRAQDSGLVRAWKAFASQPECVGATTAIQAAELWRGVRPREVAMVSEVFRTLTCIPLDLEIGARAGVYLQSYYPSHGVEIADALIAATAVVHDLELWTRNRRHYPMPELRLFAPAKE